MKENGYFFARQAVNTTTTEKALKFIEKQKESLIGGTNSGDIIENSVQRINSWTKGLIWETKHNDVMALWNENIDRIVCSLIKYKVDNELLNASIALRFPYKTENKNWKENWHVDGILDSSEKRFNNFPLLVGVYLTDVHSENCGNFSVYEKSHIKIGNSFKHSKSEWRRELKEGVEVLTKPEEVNHLDGFKQLYAKAGDVVFCHYMLGHLPAVNLCCKERAMVFFRVRHLKSPLLEALDNIWVDWCID
ncbi:hypothetical protein ABK040_011439 [Willaertia magna]